MLAFKEMLINAAKNAGMKIPADPENFHSDVYPHFTVFCKMQIGAPMPYPQVHFDNAKVIAKIPEDQIRTITYDEIMEKGFTIGYSTP